MIYKYYKQPCNETSLKIISNCLKFDISFENFDLDLILKNLKKGKLNEENIKKLLDSNKYCKMKSEYKQHLNKISYYNKIKSIDLINKLYDYIDYNNCDFEEIIFILNEFNKRNILGYDNDELLIKFKFFYDLNIKYKIDQFLNECNDELLNISLINILESKYSKEILKFLNIKTFKDLKDFSVDFIYLLLIFDIEKISEICNVLLMINDNTLINFSETLHQVLKKDKFVDILKCRNSLGDDFKTLEELGNIYGVTRERIRGIEKQATEKLLNYKNKILKIISIIFECFKDKFNLLHESYFEKYIGSNYFPFYNAVINNKETYDLLPLKYDRYYNVFYFDDALEKRINYTLNVVERIIPISTLDEYSDFEKKVVLKYFKKENKCYINKNLLKADLCCELIDELYPQGCKIHDEKVIKNINNKLNELYGINEELNDKNITSYIFRNNYCLIDRGTFINRKKAPVIDNAFISKILNLIREKEIIYYSGIFDIFKEDFLNYGIDNWFYVKGVLDGIVSDEFIHDKDYIKVNSTKKTPIQLFRKYIRNTNGVFSMNDIKEIFPGISISTMLNEFYCNDELLLLNDDNYILKKNVNIDLLDLEIIKNNIEKLFKTLNFSVIHIRKLYSRLKIMYSELFEKYEYLNSENGLFSVCKSFINDYYYSRPFISKNKTDSFSTIDIILDYISDYDEITMNMVKQFINKMNLRYFSVQQLENGIAKKFVQYSNEQFVNKEKLNLSNYELNNIKKTLQLDILNNKEINTKVYRGYINLPILKYKWNKYLLVGIINSYFSEDFIIEPVYKENTYIIDDYIIKGGK